MQATDKHLQCAHCGETCDREPIMAHNRPFCCDGCRMVFEMLHHNRLDKYYSLNEMPGINRKNRIRKDKFAFLDDESVQQQLISFRNDRQTHITLNLPQIHCSSCLWLLENLHQLNDGIFSVTVNFPRRMARIIFDPHKITLRQLAELLAAIGYEPRITLSDLGKKPVSYKKKMIYQLGVAGFCFANIMLLSLPAYLGSADTEPTLHEIFRFMTLFLSLPVLLFSARPFYESAWKGLMNRFLNIDAPVALAILITFFRSAYEVLTQTGSGYFDSMSGIVFFMLAGRVLQDSTFAHLSFERDYASYFPVSVTVLKNDEQQTVKLPDIRPGDTMLIHHSELIPADGIVTRGTALIDYSFVTGESEPVTRETGETVYAGGRQTGGNIEVLALKEVAQSDLTGLWNNRENNPKQRQGNNRSFVQPLSRYFTFIILALAFSAATFWWAQQQGSRALDVLTTVLIVACPCTLLLSQSLTNAHILRILSRNGLYLRGAPVIEDLATSNHIVFDKTGTLTEVNHRHLAYQGMPLTREQQQMVAALAAQSNHPLSRNIAAYYGRQKKLQVTHFKEITGKGIGGMVNGVSVALGSALFSGSNPEKKAGASTVQVHINGKPLGYFLVTNHYRSGIAGIIPLLAKKYKLSVISGDHEGERENLRLLFGPEAVLLFNQRPADKMAYIQELQARGEKVIMIGDGLNDAGALQQSHCGIAVTDNTNNFTPASDAILDAPRLSHLPALIRIARANRQIIITSFVISAMYNTVGLYFALQGLLSPVIAALLMPLSSVTMLALAAGLSGWVARKNGFTEKKNTTNGTEKTPLLQSAAQ